MVSFGPRIVIPSTRAHLAPAIFSAPTQHMPNLQRHAFIQFLLSSFLPRHRHLLCNRIAALRELSSQRKTHNDQCTSKRMKAMGRKRCQVKGLERKTMGRMKMTRWTTNARQNHQNLQQLRGSGSLSLSSSKDEYAAILSDLEARGANGLPSLYAKGSFFVHPKAPWFQLNGKRVTPTDLCRLRWFVWDPQALYKFLVQPVGRLSIVTPQCRSHAGVSTCGIHSGLSGSDTAAATVDIQHTQTHPRFAGAKWTMPWQLTEHGHAP